MLTVLILLLVPATALGMVLGMDRVEDSLLKQPARHRTPRASRAVSPTATS